MVSLSSKPTKNPAIVDQILDQEAILVFPEQGNLKVINEVGARIWVLLDGSTSVQEIAAILTEEFEISEPEARADTLEFLELLRQQNMIDID